MARHKTGDGNEIQQMYLLAIARVAEESRLAIVPIARLSEALGVSPVSGNQMIHKLEEAGLVGYVPYEGVTLTRKGKAIAGRLLHHRGLWREFLVDRIRLSAEDAETLACRLEHITPGKVGRELVAFLGDQGGRNEAGEPSSPVGGAPGMSTLRVSELGVGQGGEVVQLGQGSARRSFLESAGMRQGSRILVRGTASEGSVLVQTQGRWIHLAQEVAEKIHVSVTLEAEGSRKVGSP